MKRLLALAALVGGLIAAAPLPCIADDGIPQLRHPPAAQGRCRDKIRDAVNDVGDVTVVAPATSDTRSPGDRHAVPNSIDTGWNCVRTQGGTVLYACSR